MLTGCSSWGSISRAAGAAAGGGGRPVTHCIAAAMAGNRMRLGPPAGSGCREEFFAAFVRMLKFALSSQNHCTNQRKQFKNNAPCARSDSPLRGIAKSGCSGVSGCSAPVDAAVRSQPSKLVRKCRRCTCLCARRLAVIWRTETMRPIQKNGLIRVPMIYGQHKQLNAEVSPLGLAPKGDVQGSAGFSTLKNLPQDFWRVQRKHHGRVNTGVRTRPRR